MELTLNLVWLALSLGAVAAWLWAFRPTGSACSKRQGMLVLLCVAVLLFPVISVTDDLQNAAACTEDNLTRVQDAAKRSMRVVAHSENTALLISVSYLTSFMADHLASGLMLVHSPEIRSNWNFLRVPVVENRPPPQLLSA